MNLMMILQRGGGGDVGKEEDVRSIAIPSYMERGRRFLDTQYGIRKFVEQFMIGDSPVFIDTDDNFTIKRTAFRRTEALRELLTCKNVNTEVLNKADLKKYKKYW